MFGKLFSAVLFMAATSFSYLNAYDLNTADKVCRNFDTVLHEHTVMTNDEPKCHDVKIKASISQLTAVADTKITIPVQLENIENESFDSIQLIVDVNGEKQRVTLTPGQQMSDGHTYGLELCMPRTTGDIPFKITIDKVDGVSHDNINNKVEGKITVLSRQVDHKVVIEDFTGFWCGWCPKGIVAMEKIKQVYGDKAVIVTAHHNDALECKDYESLVNQTVTTFPQAHVDRTIISVDPYYGSSLYKVFGIGLDIDKRAAVAPVAEVVAGGEIVGDILTAKADVKFLYTGSTHHALAFVLTENNMHNDKWHQANSLTEWKGQPIEELEPMFDKWINGSSEMEGIVYDDVAMAAKGLEGGLAGSIPSHVTEEESNIFEVEFDLHGIKKIMNYDDINICVFLFDTNTGHIENADSYSFNTSAGIDGITEDTERLETARYTIDGRKITTPHEGMNIIKYSDGSVRKVIVR